jgi:hypothetical protein
MKPSVFTQLSESSKLRLLYEEGVYVRERIVETLNIQLFLFDGNYYEVWKKNDSGRLLNISYIVAIETEHLYPALCEWEIRRDRGYWPEQ